jgi:hypothetical protein
MIPTPRLALCAALDPGDDDAGTFDRYEPFTIDGEVIEIEVEPNSFGCEDLGLGVRVESEAQPWRARVTDGARSAWVVFQLPWSVPLLEVGDRIAVDRSLTFNFQGPATAHVEVRDEEGELIVWMGKSFLHLPNELFAASGAERCTVNHDCGDYVRSSIAVTANGETVDIAVGKRADVGDYAIVHLGNDKQASGSGTLCADWSVGHASLLAVRGTIASLDARDRTSVEE